MGTEARRCNEVNVAGDFNTKSKAWGGAKTDRREPPCSYWDPVWLHISESLEEESPFIPPLIHSSCSLVLSSALVECSPCVPVLCRVSWLLSAARFFFKVHCFSWYLTLICILIYILIYMYEDCPSRRIGSRVTPLCKLKKCIATRPVALFPISFYCSTFFEAQDRCPYWNHRLRNVSIQSLPSFFCAHGEENAVTHAQNWTM